MWRCVGFLVYFLLGGIQLVGGEGRDPWMLKRNEMVEMQIIRRGISDPRVIETMRKVKRHLFVPALSENLAYEDHPLPIGHGQTISQPFIVAYMTEAAQLHPEDTVLEIGTGSGYQAAILAEIVTTVHSVEILKPLADEAETRFQALGYKNIFVKHGDGYQGWEEHAPYDVIIVTAAPSAIPPKLIEQLKPGGRLVIPVGSFFQELYLITKTPEGIDQKQLIPVRFVPMVPDQ